MPQILSNIWFNMPQKFKAKFESLKGKSTLQFCTYPKVCSVSIFCSLFLKSYLIPFRLFLPTPHLLKLILIIHYKFIILLELKIGRLKQVLFDRHPKVYQLSFFLWWSMLSQSLVQWINAVSRNFGFSYTQPLVYNILYVCMYIFEIS